MPIGRGRNSVQYPLMSKINFITVIAVTLSFTYLPQLHGDSFRCGRKLVHTGDTRGELLRVCGEPIHKDRGRAEVDVDGIMKNVSVERWHYKKSARSLAHVVILYRGNVEKVIVGNR
jgi:hypothetical protein